MSIGLAYRAGLPAPSRLDGALLLPLLADAPLSGGLRMPDEAAMGGLWEIDLFVEIMLLSIDCCRGCS